MRGDIVLELDPDDIEEMWVGDVLLALGLRDD